MRRGERSQKGSEGKERCGNFSGLLWLPTASAVGLPRPSSLSLQLPMAGLCLPWVWGPGQEYRSEQIVWFFILCRFWHCVALPICCTQASAPPNHCLHLQVMGSYFFAGGLWGTRSCWLPWVKGCRLCESVCVLCSWHVLLEHLFCIAEVAVALLVTGESTLLWTGSSAWVCAQLMVFSSPSACLGWEFSLSCQVFLLLAAVCAGVPHQGGLVPLGYLASHLCPIPWRII